MDDGDGKERVERNEASAPRARAEVGMSPTLKKGLFSGSSIFIRSTNLEFLKPRWAAIEDKLLGDCRN